MDKGKYILVQTGEEVKFGDMIAYTQKKETSFGILKICSKCTLTPLNIDEYIKRGVIKFVKSDEEDTLNISYYIKKLASQYGCTIEELADWLDMTNKICPRAVFDILLQTIALEFYSKDPQAYNKVSEYYSLRIKDGKVGKVTNLNNYIPLFKNVEDAETARTILSKQLKRMYGK